MILQALTKCYEKLLEKQLVPKQGWSRAKVNFILEITEDGTLVRVYPLENFDVKKKIFPAKIFNVPEHGVRSNGITPQFLCDNSSYILGIDKSGKPERTANCFSASKELHLKILSDVKSQAAVAVKNFFENCHPENLLALIDETIYEYVINKSMFVFMYKDKYVHDDPEIQLAWETYYRNSEYDKKGQCLVTGKYTNLRRLHPMIKGVWGSQSSGASLVSFNASAYESYGQSGGTGLNAPVSDYAAFAYTTALNYLLSHSKYVAHIGDLTIVYWSEDANEDYNDIFQSFFEPTEASTISQQELNVIVKSIASGDVVKFNGNELKYNNKFYILGLAPNAARISVGFFMVDTFGHVLKNLAQHYSDLAIVKPSYVKVDYLPLWKLLLETINKNSKDKKTPENLTTSLIKAVLNGTMYPESFLQNIMRRLHMEQGRLIEPTAKSPDAAFEQESNYIKAAIIKAVLNRKRRINGPTKYLKEELTVSVDETTNNKPYILGRLFALYEHLQDSASKNSLNATIKDRFFNAAMATPATVFPLLGKLSIAHLGKLDINEKVYFEKQIADIIGKLKFDDELIFPKSLTLEEQGNFYVGYYHQVQKRYTKKEAEK